MRRWHGAAVAMILLLALWAAGCGPREDPEGSWQEQGEYAPHTEKINVSAGRSDTTDVELRFGAADFQLKSDSVRSLIEGDVKYRDADLKPVVEQGTGYVRIYQHADRVPVPDDWKSYWNLKLSTLYPMELDITAGAFSGDFDFSGLRLRRLDMKTGAADGRVRFDRPNRERMSLMNVKTGASSIQMYGLLNANFDSMFFEGGAGSYRLNFAGSLRRGAAVSLKAGVCDVTLEVPKAIAARVVVRGALTSVSQGSFLVAGTREYVNSAYRAGRDALEITVSMGLGSINLVEVD